MLFSKRPSTQTGAANLGKQEKELVKLVKFVAKHPKRTRRHEFHEMLFSKRPSTQTGAANLGKKERELVKFVAKHPKRTRRHEFHECFFPKGRTLKQELPTLENKKKN
ncbi:MAG: hypothetical protein IPJ30_22705 [Acidobacteria bacterium]|nr:hypothetical protein [Acidobacteriota bacterium]